MAPLEVAPAQQSRAMAEACGPASRASTSALTTQLEAAAALARRLNVMAGRFLAKGTSGLPCSSGGDSSGGGDNGSCSGSSMASAGYDSGNEHAAPGTPAPVACRAPASSSGDSWALDDVFGSGLPGGAVTGGAGFSDSLSSSPRATHLHPGLHGLWPGAVHQQWPLASAGGMWDNPLAMLSASTSRGGSDDSPSIEQWLRHCEKLLLQLREEHAWRVQALESRQRQEVRALQGELEASRLREQQLQTAVQRLEGEVRECDQLISWLVADEG